ncbi:hypothetical protein C4552_02265 [Candidatus Parcubacteria bacterium]|nr:MAG: hypothetical protein C4552_02265 [Candidatus Parcubacteria bacterium]
MEQTPPKILTDAGLNLFVDTVKLRELPLPIIDVAIDELVWHFDMPVWEQDGTDDWNLTPWQVIRGEAGTSAHQKRVDDTDLQYPILLRRFNGRLVVIDGVHRLAKAYLQGAKTIKAKIIPEEYLSKPEFQS